MSLIFMLGYTNDLQSSCYCSLLCIKLMTSYDFFTWCLSILLYENNLAIISEKENELPQKLRTWKKLEAIDLWVYRSKKKIMISRPNPENSEKYPCSIGRWIINTSVMFYSSYCQWVRKKWTGMLDFLVMPVYWCSSLYEMVVWNDILLNSSDILTNMIGGGSRLI